MTEQTATAEVNIHLRARARDRQLIDQAAEFVGSNRTQFMIASSLKEAKTVLLDQTTIHVDAEAFNTILDWMERPPTADEKAGMTRLMEAKKPWAND